MKLPVMAISAIATLVTASCFSVPPLEEPGAAKLSLDSAQARPASSAATSAVQDGAAAAPQRNFTPVLYARDGTPVSPASTAGAGGPLTSRDLAGNQGGRMHILELYQNVIEERDTLSMEVDALIEEVDYTRQALATADRRIEELEAELQAAAEQAQRLRLENVELAGRLTIAQIRRLQAEKILLESRLAEIEAVEQAARMDGAPIASAPVGGQAPIVEQPR